MLEVEVVVAFAPEGVKDKVKLPMVRVKDELKLTVVVCELPSVTSLNTIVTDPLAFEVTVTGVEYWLVPNVVLSAL